MNSGSRSDVAIIGGGLAGLSLALHLKKRIPNLSITVLERRGLPYPEATHKVGESTVEIAAHYFSEVLGLSDHLKTAQLRKLGLRIFFSQGDNESVESRVEFGTNRHFSVPTYQIDRGRFENFLAAEATRLGVTVLQHSKVTSLSLAEPHTVVFDSTEGPQRLDARWIVDASGRAGVLKRKLGLQTPSEHDANAVWFRVKGRVDIDDWGTTTEWRREHDGIHSRWYSTNHLTGEGYWVWLIPLASGFTSIGIVTDHSLHPLSNFRSFDDCLSWLRKHEPQCARVLTPLAGEVADFSAIKHYSHKCSRMISGDRWAITGDAGIFLDPLYSPGSDFIAIQNGFIVDAIARDMLNERFIGRCEVYNEVYQLLTDNVLGIFQNQYPVFGNPRIMPLKVIWDFTVYWGFLAFVTIQGKLCDYEFFALFKDAVPLVYEKNLQMQRAFIELHHQESSPVQAGFIDISRIPFLMALNNSLQDTHTEQSFSNRLAENVGLISQVYDNLLDLLSPHAPRWDTAEELVLRLAQMPLPLTKAA